MTKVKPFWKMPEAPVCEKCKNKMSPEAMEDEDGAWFCGFFCDQGCVEPVDIEYPFAEARVWPSDFEALEFEVVE